MTFLYLLLFVLQALIIYAVSWVLWRMLRQFVVQSALDNIPGPPSKSLWRGNHDQTFDVNGWDFHKYIAKTFGSVVKLHGLFGDKQLYVFDPKALHYIVVKEQDIYAETDLFIWGNRVVFGYGLLSTLGDHHRKQRKMLNPVFSIAHMRHMIPMFFDVSYKLRKTLELKAAAGPQEIDVLKWMSRTALEIIGQSGLGYSFDDLASDEPRHPYVHVVKKLQPTFFSLMALRNFLPWVVKIGTPQFQRMLVKLSPIKKIRDMQEMTDLIYDTSVEILHSKIRALEQGDEAVMRQVGQGKDILSILLRANRDASEEDRLPESEILGHVTFIFAAMDTTSGAVCRILHLLAEHPAVQAKLREEITESRKGGELDYDGLSNLPYLDAICRETLRLYPPISFVSRTTRKDTVLPISTPFRGVDGGTISEIAVPNNTNIIIAIMAANRNPEVWGPDALEWKPERWLSSLPESIGKAHTPGIYSNLMTFLGGGRSCIGFKFSQLEMKVILSVLLETFEFSLSDKEIVWNMTSIATATYKGAKGVNPQMPLRISLIQKPAMV